MGEEQPQSAVKVHKTRRKHFWEPFFDNNAQDFLEANFDPTHSAGPKECVLTPESFGDHRIFSGVHFVKCDFRGSFTKNFFVFKSCHFVDCDFGLSTWRTAKFTDCTFYVCSFSQCKLPNCIFRNCKWTKIYFSKTDVSRVNISNPRAFIEAAFTTLDRDVLAGEGKTAAGQQARLESTKATMARMLVSNLAREGDERAYYDAVRIYYSQNYKTRFASAKDAILSRPLRQKFFGCLGIVNASLERFLIEASGAANNWGASLSRPMWLGVAIFFLFSAIYRHFSIFTSWPESFMAAADITLVVGYTKQSLSSSCMMHQVVFLINLVCGLIWYAIVVPTVITRISRVR